ncbi:hypothetical protein EC988_002823 [Linderina pennispora]|nr:hypothetical protein EC988_002823 [Linderina pennispora]
MLRSKNLRRILEQALTKDICVCAVFNEDGVVLAHASAERDFSISSLRTSSIRTTASYLAGASQSDVLSMSKPASPSGSIASSLNDDLVDSSPRLSAREQLDDDLAIAASLWQGYENMASLIESKAEMDDEDDEVAAAAASTNELAMILVECEFGRVAVTRLGALRLFLLSKTTAPLGLLKATSDNLTKYLAGALQCPPNQIN